MTEPAAQWRVGDLVAGRYEVLRVHEGGAMGVVYHVRHREWATDLAVKSPRPELFRSADDRRRFVAEAETWVSLGLHPHVCGCYYVRVLDGVPRVFAEYVAGGSLRDWIDDRRLYRGRTDVVVNRILDVAIQVAWGLDHAHGRGVTHRDVKPANVLLDDASVAKLTDFGLAAGGGMTPAYASPEQAAGAEAGPAGDVYSLAVSVLEMFTGGVTWMAGPVARHALAAHRARGPHDASLPAVPAELAGLLDRCLADAPGDRPASAAEVAAELVALYGRLAGHEHPRPAPVTAELRADELNNRALSLLDLDRPAEAERAFAQALAADPQHQPAPYNAGLVRWRRGAATDDDLIAEVEALDAAGSWEPRGVLAQIHLERGDLAAARGLLDELARERPDEPEVRAAVHAVGSGALIDARAVAAWEVPWPTGPERVAVAVDAGGRFAVTGGHDGAVRLWDVHSGQLRRTLKGHRRRVHAADLTPDGRFAVTVCEDETVRLWDLTAGWRAGRLVFASPAPPRWDGSDGLGELALRAQPTAVRLSPDGRRVLYAGLDGVLRVWDLPGGRPRILDEEAGSRLVAVSADGLTALSIGRGDVGRGDVGRGDVGRGDVGRGDVGRRDVGRGDVGRGDVGRGDVGRGDVGRGNVGRGNVARLWDLAAGRCRQELAVPGSAASALCLSADGRFAAVGCMDGTITVWDGRRVRVLTGGNMADALSLGADGRVLLSGERHHGHVRCWDVDSGRCVRTFRGHRGGAGVVHLDADARFGLSAGHDRTVRRWRLPGEYRAAPRLSRPRRQDELHRLGARVDALIAEAGRETAAGRLTAALDRLREARAVPGHERAPRVMDAWWTLGRRAVRTGLRTAWSSRHLTGHTRDVGAVDLSADGRTAVSGGCDATVRLWDVDGGTCVRVLDGHEHMVESVCLSGDGRRALSSSRDGTVRLWDLGTGDCLRVLTGNVHMRESVPVRFGADGTRAVVAGRDGRIRLWDLDTGEQVAELRGGGGYRDLRVVAGDRLAAAARGDMVQLWDLGSGQCVRRLRGGFLHTMRTVSLSADGRLALTGEQDEGLRLWDTTTGDVVRAVGGASDAVAMTADGRFAVSGGYADLVSVWDLGSGRRLRVLDGHEQGVTRLALTPDGRFVLAGHRDGSLRRWELDWELESM